LKLFRKVDFYKKRDQRYMESSRIFRNLYVKNLDPLLSDNDITQIFSHYGNIEISSFPRGENQQLKGFGFIKYGDHSEAVKAISASAKILVAKDFNLNEAQFVEHYRNFGEVERYGIFRDGDASRGFVEFKDHEIAHNAKLDNTIISQKLLIFVAKKKGERAMEVKSQKQVAKFERFCKYYGRNFQIRNIPPNMTELQLQQIFNNHLTDIKKKRNENILRQKYQRHQPWHRLRHLPNDRHCKLPRRQENIHPRC